MLVDVIKTTLASCEYRDCNEICFDYLLDVSYDCPLVFKNEHYTLLWNGLFKICNDIGEQTSPFYLDK
tara:strand:+ start:5338 stop:5541 length:204 start_codon:yes stop_codon:yes gene_type:complete